MSTNKDLRLITLDSILFALRAIENDLGLPLAIALLTIAKHPGLSVNELAEQLQVPQQTASRYVAILQGRYTAPGVNNGVGHYPLVGLEISAEDPRRRALSLTGRGKSHVEEMLKKFSLLNEGGK